MIKWLIVSGLLVLNFILGAGVYQSLERSAKAQIGGGARANIAEICGIVNNQTIIYLLETDTGKMVAVRLDITGKRLVLFGGRDVGADFKRGF